MLQSYEKCAQDIIVETHLADDFLCGIWAAGEFHADVVTFANLFDFEGEAFATHLFEFDAFATVALCNICEMRGELVNLRVLKGRSNDIRYFVL